MNETAKPGIMADNEHHYVTRTEFVSFVKDVTSELKLIGDKLDTKTRPNWSAVGVGVTVIGMLIACLFYYFNRRIDLAEASAKKDWEQMNVRVERTENKLDDYDREFRTRYLNLLEEKADGRNITP